MEPSITETETGFSCLYGKHNKAVVGVVAVDNGYRLEYKFLELNFGELKTIPGNEEELEGVTLIEARAIAKAGLERDVSYLPQGKVDFGFDNWIQTSE